MPSGAGPRHLLFHPNGHLAFLVYELGNLVSSLSWSPADGFKIVDTHSTLVAFATGSLGVSENVASISNLQDSQTPSSESNLKPAKPLKNSQAATIRFTPDMRGIVVSNRGENSLAVFDFDESTGKLAFKSRTMLKGDWPRDIIFASDSLALVACERSGEVVSMEYDAAAGTFREVGSLRGQYRPSSVCPMP